MSKLGPLTVMVFAAAAAFACTAQPKVDAAIEEAAIRRTDAEWLAASTARDLERVLPFWSDHATILSPGAPAIVGKEAIRRYVSGAFATPGFSISWKTEKVEVSQSGDIAYSIGTDRISYAAADGKSVAADNRSVAIWKKQPDGSWKCILDVMNPAESSDAK